MFFVASSEPFSSIFDSTKYTIQNCIVTLRKQHHNTYISQEVIVQSDIIDWFIVNHMQKKTKGEKKKTRTRQPQNYRICNIDNELNIWSCHESQLS